MKYIVILGDGMADEPISALDGKTPLETANTPTMDELAGKGELGLVKTVPSSMKPGSDVANLAVLGYDPEANYSGRSPLEALSVGVKMEDTDVIFRCNIVTVTENEPYPQKTILDHSSGEISTADADVLMDAVRQSFNNEQFSFAGKLVHGGGCSRFQGCFSTQSGDGLVGHAVAQDHNIFHSVALTFRP